MEHLFILITMGDMLGVPILPPYYSLRLLPYVVPQISTWKRRMLREKDLTDAPGLTLARRSITRIESALIAATNSPGLRAIPRRIHAH